MFMQSGEAGNKLKSVSDQRDTSLLSKIYKMSASGISTLSFYPACQSLTDSLSNSNHDSFSDAGY